MMFAHALWDVYGRMSLDDVPEPARTCARQMILDWFGCALAGSREPLAGILRDELATDAGAATVVGTDRRAPVPHAALVNGATGHALDYDDTNTVGGFHPSAPVLPAALAIAEVDGRSGADLLTAFIVGVEVGSRYGAAMGREHYDKGWHTTSSIGVLAATAAVAWLLELDHEQFGYAMGLAASQAAGVRANFATMTKPFHAGYAAERGLLSARLAARGFVANPAAFEGDAGLVHAAGTGEVHESADPGWVVTRTLFKYHAACHGTHAAIESARQLLADLEPASVRKAVVVVSPETADVCRIDRPASGLELKFSLPATVALTLLGEDTADPATFTDERSRDEAMLALAGRVAVRASADVGPTAAVLRVETGSADREASFDIGTPEPDLAVQEQRLRRKFELLAKPVVGPRTAQLAERFLAVQSAPRIADLLTQ